MLNRARGGTTVLVTDQVLAARHYRWFFYPVILSKSSRRAK
jgi:hypothetical protein